MSITAIIVSYNSAEVIGAALSSVCAHSEVERCIVVDNASTDGTLELIRSCFPDVRIIANLDNQGFGRACNLALQQVKTEYALLLNPDAVMGKDSIEALLSQAKSHPEAAIIAPVLPWQGGDPSTSSLRQPVIANAALPVTGRREGDILPASVISGAVALWRMEQMQRIGFFDPAFFLFYEDDDISIRVRRAGYELLLVAGLEVEHIPGRSCKVTPAIEKRKLCSSTWSYLYMHRKYRGMVIALCKTFILLARSICLAARYAVKMNKGAAGQKPGNEEEEYNQQCAASLAVLEQEMAVVLHTQDMQAQEAIRQLEAEYRQAEEGFQIRKTGWETDHKVTLAAAATEHEQALADAMQMHEQQWEDKTRSQSEPASQAVWEHEGQLRIIQQAYDEKWMALTSGFDTQWRYSQQQYDAQWAEMVRQQEERRKLLQQKLETQRATLIQQHEKKRWTLLAEQEKQRTILQKQWDAERLAWQHRQEAQQAYRINAAKLSGAWRFLCSPGKDKGEQ
ncbi:MAG TPA: glycosyltransferase [Rickettsiales bacterium]|nr:glycosyltransferase [Rickettsiales bacterium]